MFGCMGYNNTFERVIFMKKDSIVTELNVNNNMIGIIRENNIDYISMLASGEINHIESL